MANKWTPGPWRVGPVDDTMVTDASGAEVAAIDGDYNAPDAWPIMEANARLIAAAPDFAEQAKWNRTIRDRVDALLAEAGYAEDCSMRNFLSQMNFDALSRARGED